MRPPSGRLAQRAVTDERVLGPFSPTYMPDAMRNARGGRRTETRTRRLLGMTSGRGSGHRHTCRNRCRAPNRSDNIILAVAIAHKSRRRARTTTGNAHSAMLRKLREVVRPRNGKAWRRDSWAHPAAAVAAGPSRDSRLAMLLLHGQVRRVPLNHLSGFIQMRIGAGIALVALAPEVLDATHLVCRDLRTG